MSQQIVEKAVAAQKRRQTMALVAMAVLYFFAMVGAVALGFATNNPWWGAFFFSCVGIITGLLIGKDT